MPINQNGLITNGTRQNLIDGVRASAMSVASVDAALLQAASLANQLVDTYSAEVAEGEVGPQGTARASEEPITGEREPTVLLYGLIQSGKTAAMILTSALCLDNGFRIIVVLTSDNVALVRQTADRFKALNGPRVLSTYKEDTYEWEGQEEELREDIINDGLVLVSAKDAFHLPRVIQFLQQIEAPLYPTVVFDDEADNATPDTTLAARSQGRANAPAYPSTIHRRVIENQRPGEEGESISEIFPHSLYIQVTATPYILFLQNQTSRLRPNITFLLEPGAGYCGGGHFFANFDASRGEDPAAPLVLVPDNEALAINLRNVPTGLASSLEFFLLSATARSLNGWPVEGYKHLSHSSHLINQHAVVASHVERHLNLIRRELRNNLTASEARFALAYRELLKTVPDAPPLRDLIARLPEAIRQADFVRVNSDTDVPHYGPRINFLIGGNILGRGLTIDNLLVTYYVREARVSQMDTIWQHARMFGYRESLMPYTRVYLPRRVAARFRAVHEAELSLRESVGRDPAGGNVLLQVARGMRATRPSATDPDVIRVIPATREQIHPLHLCENVTAANEIRRILIEANVPITATRDERTTLVFLETVLELVNLIPVREGDPGLWHPGVIAAIMEDYRDRFNGTCNVYVRRLEEPPPAEGWPRGRLGGPEITLLHGIAGEMPALALLYYGDAENPSAWYPTLVLPRDRPNYIYNPS